MFPGHIGLAKKALVIALAGITTRWKYAVAYYFTKLILKKNKFECYRKCIKKYHQ